MPRRKDYGFSRDLGDSSISSQPASDVSQLSRSAIVFLDELGPMGRVAAGRGVDLGDWLGYGIDEWVYSCIACMRAMVRGNAKETATVEGRRAGLRAAFQFLTESRAAPLARRPADLTLAHVRTYYKWLESRWKRRLLRRDSARKYFSQLKSMLLDLAEYGHIATDPNELFRDNAFRGTGNEGASTPPLSNSEQELLAKALKSDLVNCHHGRLCLRPSEYMTCRYLIVAMRTGESTMPLLELSRKQPREGPVPGTMVLTTDKRRAHKLVQRPVRDNVDTNGEDLATGNTLPQVISPDTAAVLRTVLAETEAFVALAPLRYQDRVWLYRKSRGDGAGGITALTQASVSKCTKAIVLRHGLKGDDGEPLRLSTRRLRASFGHRAYEATNGDLILTADALGNTPKVAGSNYIPITAEIKVAGAKFMNGLWESRLARRLKEQPQRPAEGPTSAVVTPVSGCNDSLHGEFAPKDGSNRCSDWVMCLFCPQFAIAGDEDELWRLFSFRGFAEKELERLVRRHGAAPSEDERSNLLKRLYRLAIPFIKQFARANFQDRVVVRAERRAEVEPHPFWAYQEELAGLRR